LGVKVVPGTSREVADEALNTRGNAYMPSLVRQGVKRTMDTNPNHGSDNCVHEVVGSAFRGGHIQRNLDVQSVTLSPRKSHQSAAMERQELGLDGRRLMVHEGLVGPYEEGKRWPDTSSTSRRPDQRV